MLYCRGELGPKRPLQSCTRLVIIRHWDLQYDFVNLWHSCWHISNYGNNSLLQQQQQLHEFFGDAASTASRRLYGAFFTMIVYGSSSTSASTLKRRLAWRQSLPGYPWEAERGKEGAVAAAEEEEKEEEEEGTGSRVEPSRAFASASRGQARDLPCGFQVDGPDAYDRYRSRAFVGAFRWEVRPRSTVYGANWTAQIWASDRESPNTSHVWSLWAYRFRLHSPWRVPNVRGLSWRKTRRHKHAGHANR